MLFNNITRGVGKSLPFGEKVEDFFKLGVYHGYYKKHLNSVGLTGNDMLVIATVARSGTHYMMLLLANYIKYLESDENGVNPSEMNELFPNNWHLAYMNYHNIPFGPYNHEDPVCPDKSISRLNVKEVTRSHSVFQKIFWRKSNVLHLYRNPLDYSVSLFNYKHKKRNDVNNPASSPSEVLELKFDNYVKMYKSYVDAAQSGNYRIFRLSYEELITNPGFYLDAVLKWLGLEPSAEGVAFAVNMSSISKTQESEKKGAVVNPTAHNLVGSFISSGQIGQWKKYYSKEEYAKWEKRFSSKGVDLNAFTLE